MVDKQSKQFFAGMMAGGGTTAILHPLDLMKVRFQADTSSHSAQKPRFYTFKEILRIRRSQGVQGIYQGFSANWLASITSWGLYFYFYEHMKVKLGVDGKRKFSAKYFAASGLAGATTVVIVNPLWVCKTRMCLQQPGSDKGGYSSLFGALRKILREEGIRGWYRGLVPGIFGVSHGAVQFTIYENLKALCNHYEIESTNSVHIINSTSSKAFAMALTYPYQVIRSRLQIPQFGTDIGGIIRRTWSQEGVAGFYKGLVPSTLRVLPGTALTFLIYENALKLIDS